MPPVGLFRRGGGCQPPQNQNQSPSPARMAAADSRREALLAAGCSTYVAYGGSITCLCCGFVSQHPEDREHRYCGFCHKFHTDWSKRA